MGGPSLGEPVAKVGKRIFAFIGRDEIDAILTVKLDASHDEAMAFPATTPARCGLGRAGWVSKPLRGQGVAPVEEEDSIDESHRLSAPARLRAILDGRREPVRSEPGTEP